MAHTAPFPLPPSMYTLVCLRCFQPASTTGLVSVVPVVLMAYLLGLMAYSTPYLLTQFTPGLKMKAADTILYGILAVFTAGLAYPYLMNRWLFEK